MRAPLTVVRKTDTTEFQLLVFFSCPRIAGVRGEGLGRNQGTTPDDSIRVQRYLELMPELV